MPLFTPRRSRSSKAANMREASRLSTRMESALRDRGILSKLLLLLVTLVGMLIAVQAWEAPFPFRIGDHIPYGKIARTRFKQIDDVATEQLKRERAAQVPLVFRSEQLSIEPMIARLRGYLQNIADARTFEELSLDTQEAFQVTGDGERGEGANSLEQEFASIHAFLNSDGFSVRNRIDEIVANVENFLAPLRETGIADGKAIAQLTVSPRQTLAVIPGEVTDLPTLQVLEANVFVVSDVLLADQLQTSGRLGKNWVAYTNLQSLRPLLTRWLISQNPVSLQFDSRTTQYYRDLARDLVAPQGSVHERNTELIPPGTVLDDKLVKLLEAEFAAYGEPFGFEGRAMRVLTVLVMLIVLSALFAYYLRREERTLINNFSRLTIYLFSLVVCVAVSRQISFDPWRAEIIPLLALTMIVAIAFNQVLATITGLLLSLIVTLSTVQDLSHFVIAAGVNVTAAICLAGVSSRSTLIKVGFLCGTIFFLLTWGLAASRVQSISELLTDWETMKSALRGAAWCLVAGYLVAGSLPFIESSFGVVTDISLLEMSDISHPLLQELVRRAPGTYNHSIAVATIGEAAADAIGANGLLVRVGAYFHDIGKMIKPEYFAENMNQKEKSRHDNLNPAMSTLIIIGHVKDGVDLAEQHHMPQAIIDFIEQHHGTTLVEYFFREAERKADEMQTGEVEESSFRYPGPKPLTREAAVMMLADAVESATRTLVEPTAKRIESLVDKLLMNRLLDGQFDESTLTLTELHIVKESLVKSLIAVHHGRVKYPDQKTA